MRHTQQCNNFSAKFIYPYSLTHIQKIPRLGIITEYREPLHVAPPPK